MSIETDLTRIADALETIAKNMTTKATTVAAPAPVVQPTPQVTTPPAALTAVAAPFPAQPVAAPIVAPAPAAPVEAIPDPFGGKGLMGYAMESYQAMGAVKGAQIQTVIQQLGHQNINDLRPDQYVAFHDAVEKLKVS